MKIPQNTKKHITDEMFKFFVECYDTRGHGVELSSRIVNEKFKVRLSHCRWRHECIRRGFQVRKNSVIRKLMRLRAAGFQVTGLPEEFIRAQRNREILMKNKPTMREKVIRILIEQYGGNPALGI